MYTLLRNLSFITVTICALFLGLNGIVFGQEAQGPALPQETDIQLSAVSTDPFSVTAALLLPPQTEVTPNWFVVYDFIQMAGGLEVLDSRIVQEFGTVPNIVPGFDMSGFVRDIQTYDELNPASTYIVLAKFYEAPEGLTPEEALASPLTTLEPFLEITDQVVTQDRPDDFVNCYVTSLETNYYGEQDDSFWDNRRVVEIIIRGTHGCINNTITFNLYGLVPVGRTYGRKREPGINDTLIDLPLIFNKDRKITLRLKIGDERCSETLPKDCNYLMKITDDSGQWHTGNVRNNGNPGFENGGLWNLMYNACTYKGWVEIITGWSWTSVFTNNCQVPWEIAQIYPPQEGGEFINISNASIFSQDTRCLDENDQPIPNCYGLLEPLPGISRIDGETTIGEYLNTLIRIAIGLLGLFAVIMIVVGGLQYMSTDAISGKSEGRDRITKALLGLLLALGSFTMLNTINPDLTVIDPNASVDLLDITVDGEGNIRANQFIEAESEDNVGATFQMGTLSPEVEAVAERIENGITISNINVRGDEGSTHGEAQIIFNDGSVSDWFNIRFGYAGLSSSWTSGQGMSPTGQFTLGSNRNDFTLGNNQAIMSLGSPRSNLGAAFISIDQANYVGIGIHGHHSGGLNNTAGCIRMTNADLMIIFDGIVPGESTITITAN